MSSNVDKQIASLTKRITDCKQIVDRRLRKIEARLTDLEEALGRKICAAIDGVETKIRDTASKLEGEIRSARHE